MVILRREEDPAPFIAYELISVPTVLFKGNLMRKDNKAQLAKALISNLPTHHSDNTPTQYVLTVGLLFTELGAKLNL